MQSDPRFANACFGNNGGTDFATMLRDPLVIKVAKVPASIAATVGWRVYHPIEEKRDELTKTLKNLGLVSALESAQVAADCKGSQGIYLVDEILTLVGDGDPLIIVQDRNHIADILGGSAPSSSGRPNTTVTRFWDALVEYRQVLGRLKRRLATVVIFKEHGLKRELENSDDPQAYLEELTGELYHSLGSTGIMVIDSQSDANVLDLSLNNIEKAVEPWQQILLSSAGGLTEQQLWGGTKRSLGLSGIDEQSRRATGEVVDAITSDWGALATYFAQELAYGENDPDWEEIEVTFNRYDASTLVEVAKAQRLSAEADQKNLEMGVLSKDEIRSSRHGGEGFGSEIKLQEE